MQQGQAECVDLTPLPRYGAGLAVLHITPAAGGPAARGDRTRAAVGSGNGRTASASNTARPGRAERGSQEALPPRQHPAVLHGPRQRTTYSDPAASAAPTRTERNGWSARLPNIADKQNVQRKVGVERSPWRRRPRWPAQRLKARMSSGAWIRYTASAAGVRGRDPAFADAACAAVQPCSASCAHR